MSNLFQVRISTIPVLLLSAALLNFFAGDISESGYPAWGALIFLLSGVLFCCLPIVSEFIQKRRKKWGGGGMSDLALCSLGCLAVSGGMAFDNLSLAMVGVAFLITVKYEEDTTPVTLKYTLIVTGVIMLAAEYVNEKILFLLLPVFGIWTIILLSIMFFISSLKKFNLVWLLLFFAYLVAMGFAGLMVWNAPTESYGYYTTDEEKNMREAFGDLALISSLPAKKGIKVYYRGKDQAKIVVLSSFLPHIKELTVEVPGANSPRLRGDYDLVIIDESPDNADSASILYPQYAKMAAGGVLVTVNEENNEEELKNLLSEFKYTYNLEYPDRYRVFSNSRESVNLENFGDVFIGLVPQNPFVPADVLAVLMKVSGEISEENVISGIQRSGVRFQKGYGEIWMAGVFIALFWLLKSFCHKRYGSNSDGVFSTMETGAFLGGIVGVTVLVATRYELEGPAFSTAIMIFPMLLALKLGDEADHWRRILSMMCFIIAPFWLPYGFFWLLIAFVIWRHFPRLSLLSVPMYLMLLPIYPQAALLAAGLSLVAGVLTEQREFPAINIRNYNSLLAGAAIAALTAVLFIHLYIGVTGMGLALLTWRLPVMLRIGEK